jgi:hypothetical protein
MSHLLQVVRLRETMEKMSQQLTKNVEDKDAALLGTRHLPV